jgi:hypothetical protein
MLCFVLAAAACAATTTTTGVGPLIGPGGLFAPQPKTAWEKAPQGRDWTEAARAAIDTAGPALVAATPKDIAAYCPRYGAADPATRRDFWVVMLSQIAQIESGLDPAKAAAGAAGGRGLLQISSDAARRYGCAIASDQDLLDPAKNIACGAKILASTSGQDGYVAGYNEGWRGASRYWLELRKPDGVADLQNVLNAQSFCARSSS